MGGKNFCALRARKKSPPQITKSTLHASVPHLVCNLSRSFVFNRFFNSIFLNVSCLKLKFNNKLIHSFIEVSNVTYFTLSSEHLFNFISNKYSSLYTLLSPNASSQRKENVYFYAFVNLSCTFKKKPRYFSFRFQLTTGRWLVVRLTQHLVHH